MNSIAVAVKSVLNLIYPMRCASCGEPLDVVNDVGACSACESRIRLNPEPYCLSCGRSHEGIHSLCNECRAHPSFFSRAFSACLYEDSLKEMIHAFKYRNNRAVCGILSRLMADFIRDNRVVIDSIDIITFVPLHPRKQRERGFNQSEVLASSVSQIFRIPMIPCLDKMLHTKSQNSLKKDRRMENLNGAFRIRNGRHCAVSGKHILLIDDVMTTGATLNECSRVLLEGSAAEVRCLTIARGA